MYSKNKFLFLIFLPLILLYIAGVWASEEGENIALGKPYDFSDGPNYSLCTDPDDIIQLTDGEYVDGYFWTMLGTVGWIRKPVVSITIDLGKVEPIRGVSFNTAARNPAGVQWPRAIGVFVSDDGKDYYFAGELLTMHEGDFPSSTEYQIQRFKTCRLETKGRYVRFTVMAVGNYIFTDEIEVYRGSVEYLSKSPGIKISDFPKYISESAVENEIKKRIKRDIAEARKIVNQSSLSQTEKKNLIAELTVLDAENLKSSIKAGDDFKAIIPLNPLHERVFEVVARLRRAEGAEELIIWKKNRWEMLLPTEQPSGDDLLSELDVVLMSNEYRSKTFNITNNSSKKKVFKLKLEELPGGLNPDYIKVHQVEFVDTREGIVIADALPFAKKVVGSYEIEVPAGLTRQVWLTFNPQEISAGAYQGRIVLEQGKESKIIPLTLKVSTISFPDSPTLSLTVWDYMNSFSREIPENLMKVAVEDMKEHFVNSPWATGGVAPWPSSIQLVEDDIYMEMDFTEFDKWVSNWPGAKNYFVYLSVKNTKRFLDVDMNDPLFTRLVGYWAGEWAKHVKSTAIDPSQVHLLIVDEPKTEEQDRMTIAWAKAIKSGAPDFVIFVDPIHEEPWNAVQEMFEVCDIICPTRSGYLKGEEQTANFYRNWRDAGKILWVYDCIGGRTYDPYHYHRLQQWEAWKMGAKGTGFWSYADGGKASPWNEYTALGGVSYTPVYIDKNSITTGKHWEAIREGIEDYEYLSMLSNLVEELKERGINNQVIVEAKELLQEAPERVLGNRESNHWVVQKDCNAADVERLKLLQSLESLITFK